MDKDLDARMDELLKPVIIEMKIALVKAQSETLKELINE